MTRKELLKLGEDALKQIKAPFKLAKEKKQLETWILEKEEKIAELESKVNEEKCKEVINFDTILNAEDELQLAKRRLKQGQDLMEELFVD